MFAINSSQSLSAPPTVMDFATSGSVKAINGAFDSPHHRHIWIITGPAGCGKSTVAQYLAKELSLPYIEGDDVRGSGKPKSLAIISGLTQTRI